MRVEPALAVSWDTPEPLDLALPAAGRGPLPGRAGGRGGGRRVEPRAGAAPPAERRLPLPGRRRGRARPRRRTRRDPHPGLQLPAAEPAGLRRHPPRGLPGRDPDADRHRAVPAGPGRVPRDLILLSLRRLLGAASAEPVVRMRVVQDPVRMRAMLESGRDRRGPRPLARGGRRLREAACCRRGGPAGGRRRDASAFASTARRSTTCACVARCTSPSTGPLLVERTLMGFGVPASQLASPGTVGFAPAIRSRARRGGGAPPARRGRPPARPAGDPRVPGGPERRGDPASARRGGVRRRAAAAFLGRGPGADAVGEGPLLLRRHGRRHRRRGRHPRLGPPHPGSRGRPRGGQPLRLLEPRGGPAAARGPLRPHAPRPAAGPAADHGPGDGRAPDGAARHPPRPVRREEGHPMVAAARRTGPRRRPGARAGGAAVGCGNEEPADAPGRGARRDRGRWCCSRTRPGSC